MKVIPFEPHHARLIRPHAAQVEEAESLAAGVPPGGKAYTAVHDGLPVACFGYLLLWQGRGYAWALLDEESGPRMLSLTRVIRSLLDAEQLPRVEMAVAADFAAGCRWAELLGFERESDRPARKFFPNGRDAWLYARV